MGILFVDINGFTRICEQVLERPERIGKFVDDWSARLAAAPPIALAMTKRMLDNSMNVTREEALDDEGVAQTVNFGTHDTAEAMAAFVGKRPPTFTGR